MPPSRRGRSGRVTARMGSGPVIGTADVNNMDSSEFLDACLFQQELMTGSPASDSVASDRAFS